MTKCYILNHHTGSNEHDYATNIVDIYTTKEGAEVNKRKLEDNQKLEKLKVEALKIQYDADVETRRFIDGLGQHTMSNMLFRVSDSELGAWSIEERRLIHQA